MYYQVGYVDIFKPIIYGTPIMVIIGGSLLYNLYKEKGSNKHTKIAFFIFTVAVSVVIILFSSEVGSGWTLEGNNQLIVKAFEIRNIQLSEAKVDLVDSTGQWQLSRKRVGYNSDDLNIGFFYLRNGKPSMVFHHLTSPKTLLILANNEYIVLSHPGIETLYYELLNRGVQKITQYDSQVND